MENRTPPRCRWSAGSTGSSFADIVARESAIKAVGLAHGLRRALSPEARNRIRFEMQREVKRARKQRRADQRAACEFLPRVAACAGSGRAPGRAPRRGDPQ